MKALIYTDVETLVYRDVPAPVPLDGDTLIRIQASGICGSDMHAFLGHDERRPAPLILGHEAAGVVVGGDLDGKRVTINPLVPCGTCRHCASGRTNLCAKRQIISMRPREGAFAQFVSTPPENLVPVPDHVSLEKAALTEPLACGWHAVRLGQSALGVPLKGLRCLVIGGGAVGVSAALTLGAFGADDIVLLEPNAVRRARLDTIEGFRAIDPSAAGVPEPGTVDLIVDGVGFGATRAQACALIRSGGVIAQIGLGDAKDGLDIRRMTLQEIQFIGCYTYTADDFRDTAQAIFDGRLGALDWIEMRPLAGGQQAFADIRAGKVPAPKIILVPAHEE